MHQLHQQVLVTAELLPSAGSSLFGGFISFDAPEDKIVYSDLGTFVGGHAEPKISLAARGFAVIQVLTPIKMLLLTELEDS